MIVSKGISLKKLVGWTAHHVVWLMTGAGLIAWGYHSGFLHIQLPWLPISVIGTAVAFYIGFKNNQAYDRMWEARKIWGGIVNSSRAWGMYVEGFIGNQFRTESIRPDEIHEIKRTLLYRHIAWLYSLRKQLLVSTSWEHINQGGSVARYAQFFQTRFGIGLVAHHEESVQIEHFLEQNEFNRISKHANPATQLLNEQSRKLTELRAQNLIDDFRHMELERILYDLLEHQGKCERIKKFPLPRQYANMSRYFVGIFVALLPFSMIPEIMKLGEWGLWLSIPLTALVGWVYVMMEVVGDYSENPFQGMANDIPMLSLCRVIEIDLREMLGEKELPKNIEAVDHVLM